MLTKKTLFTLTLIAVMILGASGTSAVAQRRMNPGGGRATQSRLNSANQTVQSATVESESDMQINDAPAKSIVGSWYGAFSSPDFGPLPALFTFSADGTVVETDGGELQPAPPDAPYYTGPGHGAWRKVDKNRVAITFMIIAVNPDGTLNATGKVRLLVTLSGVDAFSGTGSFAFFDADGNPIDGASGDESIQCTRIKAD
jgi:hypothetical protein